MLSTDPRKVKLKWGFHAPGALPSPLAHENINKERRKYIQEDKRRVPKTKDNRKPNKRWLKLNDPNVCSKKKNNLTKKPN